jgi:hypothetical protein
MSAVGVTAMVKPLFLLTLAASCEGNNVPGVGGLAALKREQALAFIGSRSGFHGVDAVLESFKLSLQSRQFVCLSASGHDGESRTTEQGLTKNGHYGFSHNL